MTEAVLSRLDRRLQSPHARQRLVIEADHEARALDDGLNLSRDENWYSASARRCFLQGILVVLNVQFSDADRKQLWPDRKSDIHRWGDAFASMRKLTEYVEPQSDQLAFEPLTCRHTVGPLPALLCRTRR
jgi:hypothetical protein